MVPQGEIGKGASLCMLFERKWCQKEMVPRNGAQEMVLRLQLQVHHFSFWVKTLIFC